ncbi:tetratricopeptide repeat protein [Fulvivirga lutea]|uniref:CHAT domain-containing protein n=1 Tax=Fulvivirga lutea TaxID=2810512 RepID=A0A974WNU1_9BACT|nr:tetratricopeptide repeat protein [Fulvivirga lutea]QSE98898.1 CHAT domain-containing protein [Fulvivirga lutea]
MIQRGLAILVFICGAGFSVQGQDWVSMYNTSLQEYNGGNLESALVSAKNCLKTYQSQDGSLSGNYESILRLLTDISFSIGNYEEGLEYCKKELDVKSKTGNLNNLEHANALYNKGSLELILGKVEEALATFNSVNDIYQQFYTAADQALIDCQWKIANCQYILGETENAYEIYNATVPNYNIDEGLSMDYVQATYDFSNILIDRNNYTEAYRYILILESVYEQLGDGTEYEQALIHTNKGLCLHKANDYKGAEEAYLEADNLFRSINEENSQAYFNMINLRAVNFEKLGDPNRAAKLLELIGDSGDDASKSLASTNEGMMRMQEGKYEEAENSFSNALSSIDKTTNPKGYVETSIDLVSAKLALNKLEESKTILDEIKPAVDGLNTNDELRAKYLYHSGIYKNAIGSWNDALTDFESALAILNTTSNTGTLKMNTLSAIAVVHQENGAYKNAENYFMQQLQLMDQNNLKGTLSYAITLNNLGIVKQNQAEFLDAQSYLERSKSIVTQQAGTNSDEYAGVIENLGLTLTQLGEYSRAEELINQSIQIRKSNVGDAHPAYANALQNLGRLKQLKGRYQEAEPLFAQALEMKKKAFGESHPEYANALNSSALLYQTMGNFEKAEPLFIKSADIFKARYGSNHPEYATALENLATLYKLEGKNEQSLQLLETALEIDKNIYGTNHPRYATTLHNLASLYEGLGNVEQASSLYQQALDIDKAVYGEKHPAYASTLYNLATLNQQLQQFDQAETNFKKSLDIRKEILGDNHPDYAYSLYGLAGLYHGTKRLKLAKPYYDEVIVNYLSQITEFFPSLSENEKGAFYAKIRPVIESYQDFCIDYARGSEPDAKSAIGDLYNLQLRTKALLLHSSNKVRNRIFSSNNQQLIDEYLSWTELKERLSKYLAYSEEELREQQINISDLSNEINSLEKSLSQRSELFAEDVDQKAFKWQDIRDVLNEGQAALEIIRVKKRFAKDSVLYVGLIVKKNSIESPEMVLLKDGEKLENRFFNYYRNAIKFTVGDDISYKEFWHPFDKYLDDVSQVYASTDGIFNKININTLWDTDNSEYVIDEYIVRNISNTKEILIADNDGFIADNTAQVFGFPDYDLANETEIDNTLARTRASEFGFSDIIPELPGTRDEVNKLNELLGEKAWDANLYLREDASENKLKSIEPPKLLHIATHGFFKSDVVFEESLDEQASFNNAEKNPLFRSGLLFAGSAQTTQASNNFDQEDGVLTAYEAMNLNLDNTELVVLSACETGIGEVKNGEGVYGLQRSFMVAGAKAVIMSLWQVDDNTTQQLMVNFYKNWLSGTNKFESFKNAQLELKQKYADPFHWGAFIIIGTD